MQPLAPANRQRIQSIDMLRGIVMVIMALDHIRDYFHIAANTDNPLNLATTTPWLFFTRWITHFCAPIFVFLSGTSIYLQGLRKSKRQLSSFVMKRGLWLVFAELILVSFAWSFNPHYNFVFLQVIWAIGMSMLVLGLLLRWLPFGWLLALGLIIVLGHNLLDIPESAPGFKAGFWWDILHHGNFVVYPIFPSHAAFLVYAFIPWTGLMILGYCTGRFFGPAFTVEKRRKYLLRCGAGLLVFFALLRYSNLYGDPVHWTSQPRSFYSFLSFINVNKYPPSLLYMSITIGTALLLLAWLERVQSKIGNAMIIYGRVPFFYYIVHLYLIHLMATIAFFMRGHSVADMAATGRLFPFYFVVPGEGYGLPVVYLVWICAILILYPMCRWYDRYKSAHRHQWWLSYL